MCIRDSVPASGWPRNAFVRRYAGRFIIAASPFRCSGGDTPMWACPAARLARTPALHQPCLLYTSPSPRD
eukprot:11666865-Alexandrium_andersonii.AAC.1